MDLDSSNFDPKRYVLTMLKQSTIKQLIRKNNEIDQEIKVHDHEIQSLVFENYSKFISSIDTVREMKDNICMVDDKLKVLEKSMDKISDLALKVDETFKFKRAEIQKLDTVNKDLQKLRNLCDFPNVLKQDLNQYKSTHENKLTSSFTEGRLFKKSITIFQECFKTLEDLKQQPLIEPIYKQSINKMDELKSILRTRQVQYSKQHLHSDALRAITKKLIIISDQQNQVSVLRSYFHGWKDRLISKKKNYRIENNEKYDKSISLSDLLASSGIPEVNQIFWDDFLKEFSFLYSEVYEKLILTNEIVLLTNNFIKELLNWAITNQLQEIPLRSSSIKSYVHANHIVSGNLIKALNFIKTSSVLQENSESSRMKLYSELSSILQEKIQNVGNTMLNFVFGRLKIACLQQVIQSKRSINNLTISSELLKESYIKVLGPIKENFKNNFEPVLNDLQHLNSSYEHVFASKQKYDLAIHNRIDRLVRFLSLIVSLNPEAITEEFFDSINNSTKLHKLEKSYIEAVIKQFSQVDQNGPWFVVSHNYLNYLNNHLGKKIIESAHKRIEASKNYNYASVFTYIKERMGKNLYNLIQLYSRAKQLKLEAIFTNIHDFIEIVNSILPDSRKNFSRKPSFLSEKGSFYQETEIMSAKKLRIIEKPITQERSSLFTVFIRRLLKLVLIELRAHSLSPKLNRSAIYSIVQICYEMSNVNQQPQISAFYSLFTQYQCQEQSKLTIQTFYLQLRKQYIELNNQ